MAWGALDLLTVVARWGDTSAMLTNAWSTATGTTCVPELDLDALVKFRSTVTAFPAALPTTPLRRVVSRDASARSATARGVARRTGDDNWRARGSWRTGDSNRRARRGRRTGGNRRMDDWRRAGQRRMHVRRGRRCNQLSGGRPMAVTRSCFVAEGGDADPHAVHTVGHRQITGVQAIDKHLTRTVRMVS